VNQGEKTQSGTPAQNQLAQSLNLQAGDFPSAWTKESPTGGANSVRDALNGCVFSTSGAVVPAASAISSNFLNSSTGQEVGSQVQVFDSNAQASTNARHAASTATSSCMVTNVKAGLQKTLTSTVTLQNVGVKQVTANGTGKGGFAQLVGANLSYPGKNEQTKSTTVYVEVVGFPSGTALVEAEFENTGSPPPSALVTKTMGVLTARANAK
jgi:hypothetical protein